MRGDEREEREERRGEEREERRERRGERGETRSECSRSPSGGSGLPSLDLLPD